MVMSSRLLVLAPAALLLGGCAVDPVTQSFDPSFGEALKYDQAMQTVNPDPVYGPDSAQPGEQADKLAPAVKRYRTDAVKPVEQMQTSQGSSSSGGGPR
jgi:hypothetical protein